MFGRVQYFSDSAEQGFDRERLLKKGRFRIEFHVMHDRITGGPGAHLRIRTRGEEIEICSPVVNGPYFTGHGEIPL